MKIILFLLSFFLFQFSVQAQWKTKDPVEFQTELNEWYKCEETSPFQIQSTRDSFQSLNYFKVNTKYQVEAIFHKIEDGEIKSYPTSSGQNRDLQEYGYVEFTWKKKTYQLVVLEEMNKHNPEYANHLDIPFYDNTNNKQSYGGGRYLGFWKDELVDGKPITLDFNLAYNPYCAYTNGYSCLIPPEKNRLDFKVKAGVKKGLVKK